MASITWWRSWHNAPMDNKWPVIAARAGVKTGVVSAIAWALLDYASQHENRGTVEGFDTEVYAVYSGFPEDEIKAVISAMTDKAIIVNGRLANWEKRQPKREDDSYNRVTKFRELKRNVTQCNAEISPDKDTDKDKELINPLDNFLSHADTWIGCPVGGNGDVDTIEVMAEQFGIERMKRAAAWIKEKGTARTMNGALKAMNTALKNGGFQEENSNGNGHGPPKGKRRGMEGLV